MTGRREYENKLLERINYILRNNDEYLENFYSFLGVNKTLETKYNYLRIVAQYMKETNKEILVLTMNDFSRYINNVYQIKSSSYAITTYAALKLFGKYLYVSKILTDDPMIHIERPKYRENIETQQKRDIGFLDKKEIKEYMYTVKHGAGSTNAKAYQEKYKNRDLLICSLLLTTGMRCSALMKIDINDIDINKMELRVYDKGNKLNNYALSEDLIPYIQNWLIDRKAILNGKNENALFISNQKVRMSQASISRVVTKYAEKIEGKHITPHKLRATYGTQVYAATHDIYYTQKCMHHSSPKVTELYIRGEVNNTSKASDIMGKLL